MKREVPEYDHFYNALSDKGLGYLLGQETRPSGNRPNGLRVKRAEIYHQILKTKDRNERKKLFADAHEFGRLNEQLMDKQLVSVEIGDYGEQTASYCVLDANPDKVKTGSPVFLWTGISNDPEGVGWLSIMLAKMTQRQIIVMGYPQGWDGNVTKEFGDAIIEKKLEPSTDFFIKATEKIAEKLNINKFGLIGISTGAALIGNAIVKHSDFAIKLEDVRLIAPAGCVNINETAAKIKESVPLIMNATKLPYLSPINVHEVEISEEKRERMLNAHRPLAALMLTRTEWWKGIEETGLKVKAIIYDSDHMTESIKIVDELKKEMEVAVLHGSHSTPGMKPEEAIRALFEKRVL